MLPGDFGFSNALSRKHKGAASCVGSQPL